MPLIPVNRVLGSHRYCGRRFLISRIFLGSVAKPTQAKPNSSLLLCPSIARTRHPLLCSVHSPELPGHHGETLLGVPFSLLPLLIFSCVLFIPAFGLAPFFLPHVFQPQLPQSLPSASDVLTLSLCRLHPWLVPKAWCPSILSDCRVTGLDVIPFRWLSTWRTECESKSPSRLWSLHT